MSECEVTIIIPTYMEGENLLRLVPRVYDALRAGDVDAEVIIVDDNSPDATAQICKELAFSYPLLLEVRMGERGLARAVLRGMQLAAGDVFVVMDGDLSHPPDKIPVLLEGLARTGADMVLGSRYVIGGSTESGWGVFRWLNSKVAGLLAWPLTRVHDPMAGFFAIPRSVVRRAQCLDPIGYKIALELIVKCRCKNVLEVPIAFQNRCFGCSKLTLREQLDYLRHVNRLYQFKYGWFARLVAFSMVGMTGLIVDLGAFAALIDKLPLGLARAMAIWLAMSWNFLLNRRFTFEGMPCRGVMRQYVVFCLGCLMGAAVNWCISMLLCRVLDASGMARLLAASCGVVAGTVFNFLFCLKLVFAEQSSPGC